MVRLRVVGIDASLTGFTRGESYEEEENIRITERSSKSVSTLRARVDRLNGLVGDTVEVVRRYSPMLTLIEGYAFNARGNSGVSLGELGGVLRKEIVPYSDVTVEVPPSVVKKFAAGKGNASKVLVASSLTKRYGITFKTDNEADAFALVKLGLVVLGYEKAETSFQLEAAETVKVLIRQETG